MDCFTQLGQDVQIVVRQRQDERSTGAVSVAFAKGAIWQNEQSALTEGVQAHVGERPRGPSHVAGRVI